MWNHSRPQEGRIIPVFLSYSKKKKIEIGEPRDLSDELKEASTAVKPSVAAKSPMALTGRLITPQPGSGPAFGGSVKASSFHSVESPHPVYSLMSQSAGMESASRKKKIVMPPRGAWNG